MASCFTCIGALDSNDIFLSYSIIQLTQHITIILILRSFNTYHIYTYITIEKVKNAEKRMLQFCNNTTKLCRADLAIAEGLVNRELKFKSIMAQW